MMEISREDLYKLVWSHPLTEIARFYGVPAAKVAQVCDAYDVARPRAGYWQKLAHGKTPERLGLDNNKYAPNEIVTIEDWKSSGLEHGGDAVSAKLPALIAQ